MYMCVRARTAVVSFVTQFDVELVHGIEEKIGKKLSEMKEVSEPEALKYLKPVSTAMKVVSMRLVETGFDEALEVVKERKESSKKRVSEWLGEAGAGDKKKEKKKRKRKAADGSSSSSSSSSSGGEEDEDAGRDD